MDASIRDITDQKGGRTKRVVEERRTDWRSKGESEHSDNIILICGSTAGSKRTYNAPKLWERAPGAM